MSILPAFALSLLTRLIAQQAVDRLTRYLGRGGLPCRTAAVALLADCGPGFSGVAPPEVTKQAVVHFCRNEWAIRLEDVMIRRTAWRYCRADADSVACRVADWMAEVLGWDAAARDAELARYQSLF
jgi:glycerol-3-phosphate dehydrogenase